MGANSEKAEILRTDTETLLSRLEGYNPERSFPHLHEIVAELEMRLKIMKLVREFRAPNANN